MRTSSEELRQRIGIDFGARLPIEEALGLAADWAFSHVDVRLGDTGNVFETFDGTRCDRVRRQLDAHGIKLGLHTLSAVNMAETAPFLAEAVDDYLQRYVDLAAPLGAEWIVVHAGFHFTGDYERRMQAGLERLARLGDYAAERGVVLLLENMNPEPADAEVRYLACDVEETGFYFDRLPHPNIRWSFTVNHAHMLPVGIEGFYRAFGGARLSEVRLADNRGGKEEHLYPGEGTVDFAAMFDLLEGDGYRGHYMLAFGTPDDMRTGRDLLVDRYAQR
ncbi:MAG: sugar phosphate isomerase/epimerase family protein [Pseudomonadota bacterium]